MQKKLISAAVAAALGTGAAFTAQTASADSVTVYGQARQELNWQDNGVTDGLRIDDSGAQTRLGVKFDKDLGNGLKALGVMEWIVELCGVSGGTGGGGPTANLTTGAVNLGSGGCRQDFATARQQWIGLKGGFGQIAFGRFNGSYKTHGSVTYDAFGATSLQARGQGGQSGGAFTANGFVDDMVEYKSPKLGMFTFQIQYGLDDPQNPAGAKNTKDDYNVAARISGGKDWQVIVASSHDDSANADNHKIGGKFKFGPVSIAAQYENVESGGAGDYIWGQVVYKVGKLDVIGGYGQFDSDAGNDESHVAVGVKYHLGKKVWTWLGFSQRDPDNGNKTKNVGLGMHISF
jgi:predicted porin